MTAKLSLFDVLKHLTQKDSPDLDFENEEVQAAYNEFMIARYVSMEMSNLPDLLPLNVSKRLPKEIHYRYIRNFIPKKYTYFGYIKKNTEKVFSKEDTNILMRYFDCGVNDFSEIVKRVPMDELTGLLDKFKKHGKKGK